MKHAFWYLLVALLAVVGCTTDVGSEKTRRQSQAVTAVATTVTLSVDPTSVVYGDSYTLTWSVSPPGGWPDPLAGTLTFRDASNDNVEIGSVEIGATSGTTTLSSSDLYPIPDHTLCATFVSSDKSLGSGTSCTSLTLLFPRGTETTLDIAATIDSQRTTTFTYGEDIHVSYSVAGFAQVAGGCGDCIDPPPPLNGTMKVFYLVSGERVPPPVPVFLEDCPVAEGMGDCDVSGVPVGTSWRIVGEFVPDLPGEWAASSDSSSTFAVTPASTTVQVTSTNSPSIIDSAVDITVEVHSTAPSTAPPTGNVFVWISGIGPSVAGPAVLGSSSVTIRTSDPNLVHSSGMKQLYATYVPDTPNGTANFTGSISANRSHEVVLDGTLRELTSNPTTWTFGNPITFTLTVNNATAGGPPAPTGTVTFYDGTDLSPSAVIGYQVLHDGPGGRIAETTTSSLSLGEHSITAVYQGDASHAPGVTTLTKTVVKATPTLQFVVNPKTSVYSQPLTLGVQVNGTGVTTPTGTVQFFDGSTKIGGAVALISGAASITTSALAVSDSRTVRVEYSGDGKYLPGEPASDTVVITPALTDLDLSTSKSPATATTPVTLTATVHVTSPGATAPPSGTVTFREGSDSLGAASVDAAGVASITISSLPVGTHHLTAIFSGPNYGNSSDTLDQDIVVDGVSTELTSTPNPSLAGQPVTFSATFGSAAAGPATGSVEFLDGATSLGTAPISSGSASFTTSTLAVGPHVISAKYDGDATHAAATASISQTVNRLPSTVALTTSAPGSTEFGVAVPLTAVVTSTSGTPTGPVTFKDGSAVIGSVNLDGAGTATLSTLTLAVGSHSITATYGGDATHGNAVSSPISHTVTKAASKIVLITSNTPAPVGFNVTFTATVSAVTPILGFAPTGSITFSEGATTLGSGSLNASGIATFSTSTLSAGSHTITATFAGDAQFDTVTSAPLTQVVSATAAAITLTSSPNPSQLGASVTLTVTVAASSTPTGNVTFKNGATTLGTGTLDATGKATLSTSTLPAGILTLSVEYAGNGTLDPGIASASHVVLKAPTTATLVASAASAAVGAPITFTVTVTSPAGTPAGDVELFDATTSIGTQTLSGGGTATFTISSLTQGQHAVTALYKGNATFAESKSNTLIETITAAGTGGADAGADGGGQSSGGTSGGSSSGASSSGSGTADSGAGVNTSSGNLNLNPGNGSGSGDDCAMTPGGTGTFTVPLLIGFIAVLARRRRKVAA